MSREHKVKVGRFEIDRARSRLRLGTEEVPVEPRVLALLSYLVENEGSLVSKDELIEKVWLRKAVSDSAMSTAVGSLRRILALDDEGFLEVESVYGRGLLLRAKLPNGAYGEAVANLPDNARRQPRICVLPLRVIGDELVAQSVARSLVEEIHSGLCRTRAFFVLSQQTSIQFAPGENLVGMLVDEFQLDYAIDGSVSVIGDQFKTHVFLVDLKRDSSIWSADFKGDLGDIFDVQSKIVRKLVGSALPEVLETEISYVARRNPSGWDPHDRVLAAMPHCWRLERQSNVRALELLDRALVSEPRHALALALKSWCLAQRVIYNWSGSRDFSTQLVQELAARAVDYDGDNPLILTVYSTSMTLMGDLVASRRAVSKAIEIDPNLAWGWNRLGWVEGYECNPLASIAGFEQSLELNPLDPMRFNCFFGLAQAHFIASDYSTSVEWLDRALFERRDAYFMHRLRAAACYYDGNLAEARRSTEVLRERESKFDPEHLASLVPFSDESVKERLAAGIRFAI